MTTGTGLRLTGEVVRPGDDGYPAACDAWNKLYPRYPEAVVFCSDTADVVNALRWARSERIAFRVRSGRHNLEGWSSVDGGLVIDVSRLKRVDVDRQAGTATVGTGLTQAEAVAALGREGYAIPTGSEGGVGLGGVVPGGGFGLLTRRLGLACDRLIGAEVVVADRSGAATAIQVSATEHPDLLWALRGGGGGNFGIATSYTLRLQPLAEVAFGYLSWSGHAELADLVDCWQRQAPWADDRLSSALEIHRDHAGLTALWFGGRSADLEQALAPLLRIGAPTVEIVEAAWPDVYAEADKAPTDVANWKFFSQFVKQPLPSAAIEQICRFMGRTPSPYSNFFMTSFGGAVAAEPVGGSAFPHRDALFYCEPGAGWNEPELTGAALGWVAGFARAMAPYVDGGYVNVPNVGAADWETQYYGRHRGRLRRIKTAYDPDHVFRFEQSIPPG